MPVEKGRSDPKCPVTIRTVQVGGLKKSELIGKLREQSIQLNEYGTRLIEDDRFTTAETSYTLKTVEITVRDLGFPNGAATSELYGKAAEAGLALCPLEMGPHLRLQYLDQPEGDLGQAHKKHQAPSGSITIASEILSEDPGFPKGFYIRKIKGDLWLRGYAADDMHIWNPEDRFIFCQRGGSEQ